MNIHFLTLDNDFPYMALTQFHLIVAGDTVMDRMTQNQVLQEGGERLCVLLEKRTVLDAGANKTKNSWQIPEFANWSLPVQRCVEFITHGMNDGDMDFEYLSE